MMRGLNQRTMAWGFLFACLVSAVLMGFGTVIYVLAHFISKVW